MPETPADPPAAPRTDAPADPRARLAEAATARPSRAQAVVAVLLAVVGFALVTQVRSTAAQDEYAGYQEQDLVDVLTGLSVAAERAESELTQLRAARDDLLTDSRSRQAALERVREEATDLAILAGAVPVTGPGLRLTLTEESGRLQVEDLVDTVQELRTAYAEAIELDDTVRVVAQTPFRDAVGGIEVDGVELSAPYVLEVVGDPAALRGALTFAEGPLELLDRAGVEVTIEELDRVDVESVVDVAGPGVAGGDAAQ